MRTPNVLALAVLSLVACGPASSTTTPGDPLAKVMFQKYPDAPFVAPLGVPVDDATLATIGAAGGSFTTTDGMLTVTLAPGTVPDGTQLSATPITNTAPGGFGTGWRLTKPDAVSFAKPVTLTFRFSSASIAGAAPQRLYVATQRANRTWEALKPTLDLAKRTMTVTTSHFSDWAQVAGLQLRPFKGEVKAKKSLKLEVSSCRIKQYPDPVTGDTLAGLSIEECLDASYMLTENWSVNGIVGGNQTLGTVRGNMSAGLFTAPEVAPMPETVTVSVEAYDGSEVNEKLVLTTTVHIVPFDGYLGLLTIRSKATSSGETFVLHGMLEARFVKSGSTETKQTFTIDPDFSTVELDSWRSETSSRVCTLAGTPTISPPGAGGLQGTIDVIRDKKAFAIAGSVSLHVPATCQSKSGGAPRTMDFDGLAFMYGTGMNGAAPATRPYRDDGEYLEAEGLPLNSTFGGKDGFIATQDIWFGRAFNE